MSTVTFKLVKVGKEIKYVIPAMKDIYQNLLDSLEEGQEVEVFASFVSGNKGTLAQINKVHKCIRDLSSHTGEPFDAMKLLIKEKSGLIIAADTYQEKSFAECTREELNLAIQAAIEIGEVVGVNLH